MVAPTTFTVSVQLPPAATVPPLATMVVASTAGAKLAGVPPAVQVETAPVGLATLIAGEPPTRGNTSVTLKFGKATAPGLLTVMVNATGAPPSTAVSGFASGPKRFVSVGWVSAFTVMFWPEAPAFLTVAPFSSPETSLAPSV